MAVSTSFTVFAGIIALLALGIYLFGIPPELKRKMEKAALKTMGENKASYVLKGTFIIDKIKLRIRANIRPIDQISKLPEGDQEDVKNLKKGLGNLGGGAVQNPLGEKGGDIADDLTSPFTGR
jgi:hypothetical protein